MNLKSLLLFPALLFLSQYSSTLSHFANAALVNHTIDDSDIVFSYSPLANWQWSNNSSCTTCLHPSLQDAFQGTLHYAIHASGPDADDIGKSSLLSPPASEAPVPPSAPPPLSSASPPPPTSSASPSSSTPSRPPPSQSSASPASSLPPPPAPVPSSSPPAPQLSQAPAAPITNPAISAPSNIPPPPPTTTDDESGKGKGGSSSRRNVAKLRRTDADDPNFVDINVTATVNFTGSAFYVFCALPVQINNASILGLTNLTFFLDGRLVGNYTHNPYTDTGSTTGFQYQVLVFSKADLPYAPHVLVIKPALGSILLLDYVQYTTLDAISGTANGTLAPQAAPSSTLESASSHSSKKDTTTFAVAIGSTMGVLAILSFGVFISICMRRRKSAKRKKLREVMEAVNRPPSPEMRGPQPFIPRYFPGNVPPRESSPPPFSPLTATFIRDEESGPSHGLDFPPVPEHLDAPAYSPPPLVLSEVSRIPVSLLAPATRMPPPMEGVELPHYHDVGRTPLVSIPMYTSAFRPDVAEPSSPSSRPSGDGDTHSSSSLLPERSDINREESAAGRTNISPLNNPDKQPG